VTPNEILALTKRELQNEEWHHLRGRITGHHFVIYPVKIKLSKGGIFPRIQRDLKTFGAYPQLLALKTKEDFDRKARQIYKSILEEHSAQIEGYLKQQETTLRATLDTMGLTANQTFESIPPELKEQTQLPFEVFQSKIEKYILRLQGKIAEEPLLQKLQVEDYQNLFTSARNRGRTWHIFSGPTNSGKTFHALKALKAAKTGIYLAPLRLMAAENWDELNSCGIPTKLHTGEERKPPQIPGKATHTSATIETLNTTESYETAVIDEAQMLYDPERGWAWTQALCGVNAKTLCITCSPEAVPLIEALAAQCNEPSIVTHLDRLTPLRVLPNPIDIDHDLPDHTAIIAFSRTNVLIIHETLKRKGCSAIYGALSPEVRREQSRRFLHKETTYLAATDAIGMGLNLPISQIVFTSASKRFNGQEQDLSPQEIKQIAGRAGRFGHHEEGKVTATDAKTLAVIKKALKSPPPVRPLHAAVTPNLQMLEKTAEELATTRLPKLLATFSTLPASKTLFQKADISRMLSRAYDLSKSAQTQLSLQEQLDLVTCPIDENNGHHLTTWKHWQSVLVQQKVCPCPEPTWTGHKPPLQTVESYVQLLSAYKWMHFKYPNTFPDYDLASSEQSENNTYILDTLTTRVKTRTKTKKK
jgi:ATP-dependent RNA helicase SUPV3L1/SUV3